MSFSNRQLKRLNRIVDPAEIYHREKDGKELSYITAWYAISEANAIFGHAGWDRETLSLEKTFERTRNEGTSCGYMARVRIKVRTQKETIHRDGTGFGCASSPYPSDAHERAMKAAETDATKRALATFGERLGLALYRRRGPVQTAAAKPRAKLKLFAPGGNLIAEDLSPEAFANGLRQVIVRANDVLSVSLTLTRNEAAMQIVESEFPGLKAASGEHRVSVLRQFAAERSRSLDLNTTSPSPPPNANRTTTEVPPAGARNAEPVPPVVRVEVGNPSRQEARYMVDKSLLTHSTARRIRNKMHLERVSSKPCLICEEIPAHAHHITFAQARGLSVKVSDEFTVPLCALHHNEVHRADSEKTWWKDQGIDPLKMAMGLWEETLRALLH